MPEDLSTLTTPREIDRLFRWEPGTARKLAGQGKLPHYRLPDGSIRFEQTEVTRLVERVPPEQTAKPTAASTSAA